MKVILRYPLPSKDMPGLTLVGLPEGAQMLSVQAQGGVAVLWAEAELNNPPEIRSVWGVYTGTIGVPDPPARYLNTVQFTSEYVIHYYIL